MAPYEVTEVLQLTSLPKGHSTITSKWVFKLKYKVDGTPERPKTRLIIRDFNKQLGVDYRHTFSPVAKLATGKVVVALAAFFGWPLQQLDVNNAFLHGFADKKIYMIPPLGYTKALPGQVCKHTKSLYSLKQASRQWNIELAKFLISCGFSQSRHDHSVFTKKSTSFFTVALVYVYDILLTRTSLEDINYVKVALGSKFTIKNLSSVFYFLDMKICRTSTGVLLN